MSKVLPNRWPHADVVWDSAAAHADALRAEISDALHAMRAYARDNPRHEYQGVTQDPHGVHAWLERNDRPSARTTGPQRCENPHDN